MYDLVAFYVQYIQRLDVNFVHEYLYNIKHEIYAERQLPNRNGIIKKETRHTMSVSYRIGILNLKCPPYLSFPDLLKGFPPISAPK